MVDWEISPILPNSPSAWEPRSRENSVAKAVKSAPFLSSFRRLSARCWPSSLDWNIMWRIVTVSGMVAVAMIRPAYRVLFALITGEVPSLFSDTKVSRSALTVRRSPALYHWSLHWVSELRCRKARMLSVVVKSSYSFTNSSFAAVMSSADGTTWNTTYSMSRVAFCSKNFLWLS